MKNMKRILTILSILGILTSIYLVYSFYNPNSSEFCNISQKISCEKVTTSKYAVFLGVPVSILGIFFFLTSFLLTNSLNKTHNDSIYFLAWNSLGLAFVVYLIFVEFLLKSICMWCTLIHITLLISFILAIRVYKKT